MSQHKNLKKLLEAESKESLIDLILSLAADDNSVEQRIKFLVSKAGGNKVLGECRKLIRSYMNNYADEHGFISWRNVTGAVKGAELAAEKAREAARLCSIYCWKNRDNPALTDGRICSWHYWKMPHIWQRTVICERNGMSMLPELAMWLIQSEA